MALSDFGTNKSEFETATYNGITGVFQKLGTEFIKKVQANLDEDKTNASYQLRQSLDFDIKVAGTVYTLRILFRDVSGKETDYWKWVNYDSKARKGGRVSGKPTLREALKKWIFEKGLDIATYFPNNKRKPLPISKLKDRNANTLAFLIARRMRKHGRVGTKFLTREIPYFEKRLSAEIRDGLKRQVIIEIQQLNK